MRTSSRMLAGLGGLACAVSLVGGCNCEKAAQDMESRQSRFIAQRKKCCDELRDLGQIQEAAECYTKLERDLAQIQIKLLEWQIACENNNQSRMTEIEGWLRNWVLPSAIACGTGGVISVGPHTANVASPFADVDLVTLELQPVDAPLSKTNAVLSGNSEDQSYEELVRPAVQRLEGAFMFVMEDMAVGGNASGLISWRPGVASSSNSDSRVYIPTNFKLSIQTDFGPISLSLLEHNKNRITVDSSGVGMFQARLSLAVQAGYGIFMPDVWVEIPVHMSPQGISFTAVDVPGLEFAPQAPHAWADWNGDWTVDLQDYSAFLEDFAQGHADLNFDGESTDEDVEIFEQYFYAEYGG